MQDSFEDDTVARVAARGGLLGLILCEHYITSGLSDVEKTLEGSVDALCRHIDKLHDLTGSYAPGFVVAIGCCVISALAMWLAAPRKVRAVAGRIRTARS